jgi:import inner membrane translocase subunit TIM23
MASLACPRATCLRSLRVSNKFTVAGRSARAPFSISTSPTTKIPKLLISTTRPSIAAQLPCQALLVSSTVARRNASSTPTPASPSSTTTTSEEILTWDRFFDLRRKRRYINLVASLITAGAAVTVFGPIIAQQDIDGWAAQISGIDPIIVLGVTTFMVFGAGWLCGPSFGSAGFKVWAGRKGWNAAIAEVWHQPNFIHG